MAALLTGQSVSSVAKEYAIPRGTVAGWSAKVNDAGVSAVSNTKKEEIGDLLIAYLRASLAALKVQVEHFSDKAWLTRQTASDLAVLHGVQTDKAIRLLEALASAGEEAAA
ncbi:MAG: hypothetical protein H6637_05360 [Ardenticatenales bacterium]|nr:hypothetical protein [Ardenticatenales bacterium]